jgi:SAM-dependent MidA family methyltransferase
MGSSFPSPSAASAEFLAAYRADCGPDGVMTFARFMALALYHPTVGYYRRNRPRVGYGRGTDFFTAATSGPVFGALVAEACVTLLGPRDLREHTFVEIGAEPGQSVLAEVQHPFARVVTARLGDPLDLAGDCVVFSNELFDAQPCIRTVYRRGRWFELAVRLVDDHLIETELPINQPGAASEGYHFDRPQAAVDLAGAIAAQPWRGLFVAFDYGKTLPELQEHTPAGTVRAYYQHEQSNDLLARPGEQDLTCHVCWDWISDTLRHHGFARPTLDFQEAFFVRHAGRYLEKTIAAEAGKFSPLKLALMQLLHPAQMGQKFQVLHALR